MIQERVVYQNGHFVKESEAKFQFMIQHFMFGDMVFENDSFFFSIKSNLNCVNI